MLKRPVMASARQPRGVSLVEIVVVIAIIAALLAGVMPELASWMRGLKVRNAAESLRNGLELARMEALKRNSPVGFWMVADPESVVPGNDCALSSGSSGWVVSVVDPSDACGAEASLTTSPQLVQRSTAGESAQGLTVAAASAAGEDANQVRFNGLGQVVAGASTIQTVDISATGARSLRVVVEPGGAIRMCDPAVGSTDTRACPAL
jgi:type IV fimbrial biogenesis protein FimT